MDEIIKSRQMTESVKNKSRQQEDRDSIDQFQNEPEPTQQYRPYKPAQPANHMDSIVGNIRSRLS